MPHRRHFITLAAAAAAFVATPAFALGSLVDVDIVDRSQNELLPVHHQRGTAWVAGRPGSRYAVRLANRSGVRVMVVLSVDGINAVTGETVGLGQVGYVLIRQPPCFALRCMSPSGGRACSCRGSRPRSPAGARA